MGQSCATLLRNHLSSKRTRRRQTIRIQSCCWELAWSIWTIDDHRANNSQMAVWYL